MRIDNIAAGAMLNIRELEGFPALVSEVRNNSLSFFTDQENQPVIIKAVIIILILLIYNLMLRKSLGNMLVLHWSATIIVFIVYVVLNSFLSVFRLSLIT